MITISLRSFLIDEIDIKEGCICSLIHSLGDLAVNASICYVNQVCICQLDATRTFLLIRLCLAFCSMEISNNHIRTFVRKGNRSFCLLFV